MKTFITQLIKNGIIFLCQLLSEHVTSLLLANRVILGIPCSGRTQQ